MRQQGASLGKNNRRYQKTYGREDGGAGVRSALDQDAPGAQTTGRPRNPSPPQAPRWRSDPRSHPGEMLIAGLWHVALAPCASTRVARVRQPPTMVAEPTARLPRVPQSPEEMVEQAARAVARGAAAGALRQTVRIVVPDDQRAYKVFGGEIQGVEFGVEIQGTSAPEDLDPWPGGLLQQYPIALDLGRRLLAGDTAEM